MTGSFGFIHEKIDIKILILFILRRAPEPVPFEKLTGLAMCDDGISYFDFSDSVSELVGTGHLRVEDDKYSLTAKGLRNGKVTEDNLPFAIRRKAENAAAIYRLEQNRGAMIKTLHAPRSEGGFVVDLTLSDGIGKIVSIDLFAASEQQAKMLEKGFRNNAEKVYNALIEMLSEA